MNSRKKNTFFRIFDKFDVILFILTLFISAVCVFAVVPKEFWHQYKVQDAMQVSITALGEKNAESQYNQITIDHLEIDGHPYDLANYVDSGNWDDSRNSLTWEDKGLYSNSVVLNIPKGGDRKIVFSSSVYRGVAQISYGDYKDIVDCYSINDGVYKYDLSSKLIYSNSILYFLMLLSTFIFSVILYCIFKTVLLKIENQFKSISKWDMLATLGIAVFSFICIHGHTDSPWSQYIPWTDSDDFIYIGWAVSKGQIPYVNFFDHKGFYFFFLEFLGYRLTNSYIGIWILEWISVFAAQLLSYVTLRKYVKSSIAILGVITGYTYTIFYLCNGNYVEAFTMPWIAIGVYLFARYFDDKRYDLNNLEIFGLAASFLIAMMMRQNSTGIWFIGCYFIVIHKLVQKKYFEILRYGIVFAVGMLITFLPGLIYLTVHGAWKDFIETYWLFNFGYVSDGGNKLHTIKYFGVTLPGMVVVASGILTFFNRKKWNGDGLSLLMYYSLYGFSLLFASMSGYTWEHYAIIMLPLFPIGFLIFFRNIMILYTDIQNITLRTVMYGILGFLIIGFLIDPSGNVLRGIAASGTSHYNSSNRYTVKVIARRIKEKTNENQKISVIGNFGAYYWVSQRLSASKYFYQNPIVSVNPNIERGYISDIEKNKPAAIVVAGTKFLDDFPEFGYKIRSILEKDYVLNYNQEDQMLYFRKNIEQ